MYARIAILVTSVLLGAAVAHAAPEAQTAPSPEVQLASLSPESTTPSDVTGLTRDWFSRLGTNLIYPTHGETADAIRRMARGAVSSVYNRCAGTMREALGWGLGDAHAWTALPSRGYKQRPAGSEAQPGDIVVWPFTYGSRNSQHIGIAVGTDAGPRLLSNLSGNLGLSPLVPGYRAYFK